MENIVKNVIVKMVIVMMVLPVMVDVYVIMVLQEHPVINVSKIIMEIIVHIVIHVLTDIVMIQCMEMEVAFVTIILMGKIVTNA